MGATAWIGGKMGSARRLLGWTTATACAVGLLTGLALAASGTPALVKEINPGPAASGPAGLTESSGSVFFSATDGVHGNELWKTDGSAAGTVMVKDINPGAGSSNPVGLTDVNGTLFFAATDGTNGVQLWKSNGTSAGTVMVKDINPAGSSNLVHLTNVNGTLFFSANDGAHGLELWKSDGTAAGTVMVKDINPGAANSVPHELTNVNGTLLFAADDGVHGTELWKSDGTSAGTVLVDDINPGAGVGDPRDLTNLTGTLFFSANDGTHNAQLWKSDGTAGGTVMVKEINPVGGAGPSSLTNVNGTLFFSATDGSDGFELWRSDGSPAGTVMVKEINPGASSSNPSDLANFNGTLFFAATDGTNGVQLWKSDGTSAGTVMVKDINPGSDSNPSGFTASDGILYFSAFDGTDGRELWQTDGTSAGTTLVADINPGAGSSFPHDLTDLSGTLLFGADDGTHGDELWRLGGGSAKHTTSTSISCSPASAAVGQATTCTATVSDTNPGPTSTPLGAVTFSSDSSGSFSNPGASCTLAQVSPGTASCSADYLPSASGSGTHSITGAYAGSDVHQASNGAFGLSVRSRTTSTSVTCLPSSVTVGQTTTCTVIVADTDSGTSSTPSGTVSFSSDSHGAFSNPGSSCSLGAGGGCHVDYTPATLDSGAHAITASYLGDAQHAASSRNATVTVSATPKRQGRTAVTCSGGRDTVGTATTCTALVRDNGPGQGPTPTGAVTFATDSSGTFDAGGSCPLVPTGSPGLASCSVSYTPAAVGSGTHTITAGYGGDATYAASADTTTLSVSGRPTATTVSCLPSSLTPGQQTTCTGTVTDTGPDPKSTPTGMLGFATASHGTFSNPGASCAPDAGGSCPVTYTPDAGDLGPNTITASYGGDAVHAASDANTTVTVRLPVMGPPRNVTLPSISPDFRCARLHCTPIANQYVCDPGTWEQQDPSFPYIYQWQQLYRGSRSFDLFWANEGSGNPFYARARRASRNTPTGLYRCLVTATNSAGSTDAASQPVSLEVAPPPLPGIHQPRPINVIVTGIEVTQAVQSSGCDGCAGALPSRDQADLLTPGDAQYRGVPMAAGKFTIVRVYAHFREGSGPTLQGATAQLEVLDSQGSRLSVLSSDTSPTALTQVNPTLAPPECDPYGLCVTAAERADPNASFNFLVPWDETEHRSLTFRATVMPPVGPGMDPICAGCGANTFTLDAVPFVPTATVPIRPIPLTIGGVGTSRTEQDVFGDADTVLPQHFEIFPYRAPLAIDNMTYEQAVAAVSQRGADESLGPGDFGIGVSPTSRVALRSATLGGHRLFDNGAASVVQDGGRPLTSVLHEIGHGLGLVHASNECGGGQDVNLDQQDGEDDDFKKDANGNDLLDANGQPENDNQVGEPWPPDEVGLINSVGLDRRQWDIYRTGSLPSTYVQGFSHNGRPMPSINYFDFMSYCASANEVPIRGNVPNAWISLRNWNQLISYYAPAQSLPPAPDRSSHLASESPLRVMAIVDSNGSTSIFDVAPGEQIAGSPTPGSPYRIELRDSTGKVLTSVVPAATIIHADGVGVRPGMLLTTTVPFAPGTAAVLVVADGRELARRIRSIHAPTARLLGPRPRSPVGRARTTVVRWTAHDPDGDHLTATVEYSPDGGGHWTVVAERVTGNSARIPSRFLSQSNNGRLRVQISDGFDVTPLLSGRLRTLGAPPLVHILGAPSRGRVLSATTLLLQGSAFDDTSRPLVGHSLRWYLGSRLIARGTLATVRNVPAGRRVIRLVATDSHGRSSQAVLRLNMLAVRARYLIWRAPASVSKSARRIGIVVASSAPATFTLAGRRYAVGPRPHSIVLAFRPGKSLLRFACSLRSAGGVIRSQYAVMR